MFIGKVKYLFKKIKFSDLEKYKFSEIQIMQLRENVYFGNLSSFPFRFAELRKDHFHEVLLDQIPPAYAHVPVSPIDVANEGVVFEATLRYPRTLQIEGSSSERKDVTVYPGSINLLPFSAVKGLIEDDALALL